MHIVIKAESSKRSSNENLYDFLVTIYRIREEYQDHHYGHVGQNSRMDQVKSVEDRQPLKNLKGYGLLKHTISLQIF